VHARVKGALADAIPGMTGVDFWRTNSVKIPLGISARGHRPYAFAWRQAGAALAAFVQHEQLLAPAPSGWHAAPLRLVRTYGVRSYSLQCAVL